MRELGKRDYAAGPGDLIELSIFEWELREETKTALFRVAESGVISIPVVGTVNVKGLSIEQIKSDVEKRLQEGGILKQPQVTADIKEFRSKRISVVGAVVDPGVYTLRENVTTLRDILSLAGGTTTRAGQAAFVILASDSRLLGEAPATTGAGVGEDESAASGSDLPSSSNIETFLLSPVAVPPNIPAADRRQVVTIDLYELLDRGNENLNMVLEPGATVFVPESEGVSVIGNVKSPGSFALRRPTTVLDAIALAGGLKDDDIAPSESCVLKRRLPQGDAAVPLDLRSISTGDSANVYLVPGDVIVVPRTERQRRAKMTFDVITRMFNFGYSLGGR